MISGLPKASSSSDEEQSLSSADHFDAQPLQTNSRKKENSQLFRVPSTLPSRRHSIASAGSSAHTNIPHHIMVKGEPFGKSGQDYNHDDDIAALPEVSSNKSQQYQKHHSSIPVAKKNSDKMTSSQLEAQSKLEKRKTQRSLQPSAPKEAINYAVLRDKEAKREL
jgi:hypothetical protein